MNIKKYTLVVLLVLVVSISFGQRKPDREKIKSLKVAYITENLNLTSKEAQAFWPIYNAHEEKMESFRKEERAGIYGKIKDMEALSDDEVEGFYQKLITLENEKHKTQQQFLKDIRKVLSAKKTFLLLKTEIGFKRRLLQQYRQKQGGGY